MGLQIILYYKNTPPGEQELKKTFEIMKNWSEED